MYEVSPKLTKSRHYGGRPPVFAVGFSCRALAECLSSSGFKAITLDAFGDSDLRRNSLKTIVIPQWQEKAVIEAVRNTISGRQPDNSRSLAFLGGGVENKPELLAGLHKHCEVLGPSVEQMYHLREPGFVRHVAEEVGLKTPPMFKQLNARHSSTERRWLSKPFLSGGGLGIERTRKAAADTARFTQEYIPGRPLGATLILGSSMRATSCYCLGITESLTAADWPGPTEFIYRGSLGPITLDWKHIQLLDDFGNEIHSALGYKGWLQVDLIEAGGELWLLEANPRWTAGMEILALAGLSPVEAHVECFRLENTKQANCRTGAKTTACKTTYYAESNIDLTAKRLGKLEQLSQDNFCDIPAGDQVGTSIGEGQPVLTIRMLAADSDADKHNMLRQLQAYREQVDAIFT